MAKREKIAGGVEERARAWAERIEGWRGSGQTQVQYCTQRGLSVWVLRKWIVKLGGAVSRIKRRPALLPIPLHPLAPDALAREAALEIALPNGIRVRACGTIANELIHAIARKLRC
ncbi:MAG: hypothetical protein ABIR94_06345 [Rubrivivax sp.]